MNIFDTYNSIDKNLQKNLLTIPPYPSVSGTTISNLLKKLENTSLESDGLENKILQIVSNPWQRAYQIEYRYKPSNVFKKSMRVIESATYDLMIGNYICCYISLVPVVETVLRDWAIEMNDVVKSLNKKGYFSVRIFSKNLARYLRIQNELNNSISNSNFHKWLNNQINYFEFMMDKVFFLSFKESDKGKKKEFNRNRVLHLLDGLEDSRISRDNTIRIFLLLDIIAELYLCQDNILYGENTFFANYKDNIDFNLRWKVYLKNVQERVYFTDMDVIKFAFLSDNPDSSLTEDQKKKFIEQKVLQIEMLKSKNKNDENLFVNNNRA